ncbi:MAG: OmpH family outer membrane protein [Bacteroidetes bacterium]|jgi:outer membrane protein|nr:OmpH family outer membrane protein [Bacteroidota bacterium]HQW46578.1 OmpH family outer membrane protein [Chitinophagaceae bacterium]MBK7040659.1 OmpH family outer membrane protein [Bacteroidota bacterium]MBK7589712.1 OmpH family outer membrane protein [Bacteroidota bacterium]MBK8328470.1 OmpH family outer membrane protein [Bacteroidota bacterium]
MNSKLSQTPQKNIIAFGKKILFIALLTFTISSTTNAQRYCVIDSKYILENLPEYKQAQSKLDEISSQWQKEIDAKLQDVDRMYKAYQSEQVMLSDDMKKKREDEIIKKEKEAKDLQKKKFGFEGELFKKRQELVKPVQDKVYNAVQKMAASKAYDVIFDKSADLSIFYADNKIDKSDEVLKELGISSPTKK